MVLVLLRVVLVDQVELQEETNQYLVVLLVKQRIIQDQQHKDTLLVVQVVLQVLHVVVVEEVQVVLVVLEILPMQVAVEKLWCNL